ncbi:MAG: hypothetical protein DCC75_02535 [Proteobacteria bacterium]|nr:MAG: hypothetical protein DCC75_02535 [Pseudomonadota bacterium]
MTVFFASSSFVASSAFFASSPGGDDAALKIATKKIAIIQINSAKDYFVSQLFCFFWFQRS